MLSPRRMMKWIRKLLHFKSHSNSHLFVVWLSYCRAFHPPDPISMVKKKKRKNMRNNWSKAEKRMSLAYSHANRIGIASMPTLAIFTDAISYIF